MAVVVATDVTTVVVETAAQIYRRRGHKVITSDLAAAVAAYTTEHPAEIFGDVAVVRVPAIPRVEAILTQDADPALLVAGFVALVAAGWDVWVVIPATRMGVGHTALRGSGVTLQQWWRDTTGTVYFGSPEVP